MGNVKKIDIRLSLNRRAILLVITGFFLLWHPGFIGSETLTLTTYYPAPYGGYVSLLTTGATLLARDGGTVGIRTGTPNAAYALDVNGPIQWGGSQLSTDQNGSIELGQNGGGTPFVDFHYGGGGDFNTRLINDASGRLSLYGSLNFANNGWVTNLCHTVWMGSGWGYCNAGETLVNINYTGFVSEWACIGNWNGVCAQGYKTVGVTGWGTCCRLQ